MKAVLKGQDGSYFTLAPKVTTIGREGCDITIQMQGIDYQHAVVEYCEQEDCLILQDLNTAQGTYVNDVRVQNAAVRLAPGDRIRFGYNGLPYELHVDQQCVGVTCPPVQQQRQAWSGSLTILNESPTYSTSHSQHLTLQQQQQQQQQQQHLQQLFHQGVLTTSQGLPFIPPTSAGLPGSWAQSMPPSQAPLPRPPLRSRPLSAGSTRRSTFDAPPRIPPTSTVVGAPVTRQGPVGGWMNGVSQRGNAGVSTGPSSVLDQTQQQAQEKDLRLSQLTEEVTRLRSFEFESFRKDQLIQQLQQQITDVQAKLQEEPSVIMGSGDSDASQRLAQLETEVTSRRAEVATLKEELSQAQSMVSGSPSMLRQELGERVKEVTTLRSELERLKRDKTSTTGLVTQMQRDFSSKFEEESTISKLTREIEVLKKDLRERDKLLANANVKVNKIREASSSTKVGEERDAREKELISLRQRFKGAESKISEQFNTISSLQGELDSLKTSLQEEKDAHAKLRTEFDGCQSQISDLQKTEKTASTDLEQAQKALESFRSQIFQTTFATLEAKPEKEPKDDELVEMLKKLLEERNMLSEKIKTLSEELMQASNSTEELKEEGEKLHVSLQECVDQLKENGRLSTQLTQSVSVIQSLTADSTLVWIRDLVADMFISELQWEAGIEEALLKCGVDCKTSTEAPGQHIEMLYAKWESWENEKERLVSQMGEMESRHEEDTRLRLDTLQKQLDQKLVEAMDFVRCEGEKKMTQAIEEARAVEQEKQHTAVAEEKQKIADLEASLEELRVSLTQRQEEVQEKTEQTSVLVTEVENYKVREEELKTQLLQLEERLMLEVGMLKEEKEEVGRRKEEEVEGFKEQVRQHSVTICSMEERVAKLNKRNKDHLDEISVLMSANSELKLEMERVLNQKPAVPPKPKVIVQRPTEEITALEQVVAMLREENVELKKSVAEQQEVILGLRRDLAGASARLSDITGEMSESQKQEMEKNRELLGRRDTEVIELRQQMAKLSKIIDKQKTEITTVHEELTKEKKVLAKYRSELDNRNGQLVELESRLKDEKDEQRKQLDLLDQEGRITSELVGIGAQCRGERHDQIIMRQREALAELRSRVKTLEQSKAPLPSPDQALQQVVMLKRELAEIRATQALAEDKVLANVTGADKQLARCIVGSINTEADMERSAHRETMDTLEKSEQTFLILLRAMGSALDLEELGGLRAMAHMPKDEREKLVEERNAICDLLASRIQVLKERITRKDELLQGYENDLSKLRQSQQIADRKAAQVDNLTQDVRSRAEESQYLRETLNRTRDKLNQEKRLNTAIKQKKTFHLENEQAHLRPQSAGHSRTQEQQTSSAARKKVQKELMKRKNYEIRTLKGELCDKEQALYDREKRLMSLETSLGLERPVEVLE